MKKILAVLAFLLLSGPAFSCDEACLRDRISVTNNIEFTVYLNWKFCEDTKNSFMQADIRSLENYRSQRLNIEHRNRMKNIKQFVEQRKEWLSECDQYLELTNHGRIFRDEATTEKIFAAMDEVATELDSILRGVTYVTEEGLVDNSVVGKKFDSFFQLVDDHKTVMMLKGQFVTN
jgi:hypothetical protein